jgi:hypothetical protein
VDLVRPFLLIRLSCLAAACCGVRPRKRPISGTVKDFRLRELFRAAPCVPCTKRPGTVFEGFTDDRGNFRFPSALASNRITAELAGVRNRFSRWDLKCSVGSRCSLEPGDDAVDDSPSR